jgi:Domain of unknown function (DUF4258)
VTKKIYVLTKHAKQQMSRRAIPARWVQAVMKSPQQIVLGLGQRQTVYLLRVVVDDKGKLPIVITMYRTTNIGKYWKKS